MLQRARRRVLQDTVRNGPTRAAPARAARGPAHGPAKRLRGAATALAALLAALVPRTAPAWTVTQDGGLDLRDELRAVITDGFGDVVAAGVIRDGHPLDFFFVTRRSGLDGSPLWSVKLGDPGSPGDAASDLALDAAGDVVAVGTLFSAATGTDMGIAKLAGTTGQVLWERRLGLGITSDEGLESVAILPGGDVVATGRSSLGSGARLIVLKLDGGSGQLDWAVLPGPPGDEGLGRDVVVDSAGDVFVTGRSMDALVVIKLSAAGGVLWRAEVAGAPGTRGGMALALVPSGDVVAVGDAGAAGAEWTAVKLSGATGAELWRFAAGEPSLARDVAVDSAGDVYAAGERRGAFVVQRYDGKTGAPGWLAGLSGVAQTGRDRAQGVFVRGDAVFAAGRLDHDARAGDFVAVRIDAGSGLVDWQLDVPGLAEREDEALALTVDGRGDPVLAGFLDAGRDADLALLKVLGATGADYTACSNKLDDDGDLLVDWTADPGCGGATDLSERSPLLPCDDGADNDGDRWTDYPGDVGCASPTAPREDPQCQNGRDDDRDLSVDFDGGRSVYGYPIALPDWMCSGPTDDREQF